MTNTYGGLNALAQKLRGVLPLTPGHDEIWSNDVFFVAQSLEELLDGFGAALRGAEATQQQAKHIIEVAIEHLEEAVPRLTCDRTLECAHCDAAEVIIGLVRARNLLSGAALGRTEGEK